MYFNNIFKNKKILITGHTGFKGSWLSLWLSLLDAKIYGVSLYTPSPISHYDLIKSNLNIKSYIADINNFQAISISLVSIFLGWVIYNSACKSPLGTNNNFLMLILFY